MDSGTDEALSFLRRLSVLVCPARQNEEPQTRGLTQREFIFPQLWRLEVQDQELENSVSAEVSLPDL